MSAHKIGEDEEGLVIQLKPEGPLFRLFRLPQGGVEPGPFEAPGVMAGGLEMVVFGDEPVPE